MYCCEEHVELALDYIVDEKEAVPIFEKLAEEKQLSTTCEFCRNKALYIVSN